MSQSTPASTLEHLARLAAKPGVQSTLILSKTDGTVIQSTGLLAAAEGSASLRGQADARETTLGERSDNAGGGPSRGKTADEVARMVFAFVDAANAFTEGLNASDEVRLLRMRTTSNEIVIVPDPKFLLVLIHDAPSA